MTIGQPTSTPSSAASQDEPWDLLVVGGGTAGIDGTTLRFRQALVATGASPAIPPIPGLSDVDYLTSDTVWGLSELPAELVVLGGGSIGCGDCTFNGVTPEG